MDAAALDRLSFLIIQAAIEIHRALGPGLLESVYRKCLIYELRAQLLTYLRVMDKQLGLLLHFNVDRLVLGVDRVVNKFGLPSRLFSKSTVIPIENP